MIDISKNKTNNKIMIYTVGALALTLLAVIFKTLAMLFFFDGEVGYYNGDFADVAFKLLYILGGGFLLSSIKTVKPTDELGNCKKADVYLTVASALAAIVFFLGFFLIKSYDENTFVIIIKWSSFASALFFALNSILSGKKKELQAFLGFGIIAWAACIVVYTYFDSSWALNGPLKVDLHLALISILFFTVNELRALLGQRRNNVYLSSSAVTVFLGFSYSLPSVVYRAVSMKFYNGVFSWDIVVLALSIYAGVRLISLISKEGQCDAENNDTEKNV